MTSNEGPAGRYDPDEDSDSDPEMLTRNAPLQPNQAGERTSRNRNEPTPASTVRQDEGEAPKWGRAARRQEPDAAPRHSGVDSPVYTVR